MDWMRGIAACWIALFHFNEGIEFEPNVYRSFCKYGWLGVPMFFVISGWCMSLICAARPSPTRFLVSRCLRIMLPYWISLVVVAIVVIFRFATFGTNDVATLPLSFGAALATFSLTTSPLTQVSTVNWVYWTLSIELVFYVLIFMGLAMKRPNQFLGLVSVGAAIAVGYHVSAQPGILSWCRYIPFFMMGMWSCEIVSRVESGRGWLALLVTLGVFGTLIFLFGGFSQLLVSLSTVALLTWGRGRESTLIFTSWISRGLAWLGKVSFSLYLIHVPVGVYLLLRLRTERVLSNEVLNLGADLAALGICLVLAWLFYRTVELPAHKLARQVSKEGIAATFRCEWAKLRLGALAKGVK